LVLGVADSRAQTSNVTRAGKSCVGAKTWMLVYADSSARAALQSHPALDRAAADQLAKSLFPGERLTPLEDGDLVNTCPAADELYIASFDGVSTVAAKEFGLDRPSQLPQHFILAGGAGLIYLHAMHSVVDWFAFAQWSAGKLIRSLSLAPDQGILEDVGPRLPFEQPYWSGENPPMDGDQADEEYPLPFHPLELGEAALREMFGYVLEGDWDATLLDPESIPLMRYQRGKSRWRFWR
jgi:hypothetical protein